MKVVNGFLSVAFTWAMLASVGSAAITFSFGPAPTFFANSGVQQISVFANSTLGGGESASAIGADFLLSGGATFNTPNAGTFGGAGFIGTGNIIGASSSFDRDPTPGFENTGYLNINFSSPQSVANAVNPLATLLVDTTGLAGGSYNISATNGFFGLGSIADAGGSFNVLTAVPEPGSIVGASVLGMVGYLRWRQKRKVRGTPAIA